MTHIHVCPESKLSETLKSSGARHLIVLTGPEKLAERPADISGHYLHLRFNDIAEPREGFIAPQLSDVQSILTFAERWDGAAPLVMQCWMGISRSPAAALIALARLQPERSASELADALRQVSPEATPNALMIAHADRLLNFGGQLVDAVRAIGRGAEASVGTPFSLPVIRP